MELDLECVLAFCNEVRTKLDRQPVEKLRKGLPTEPQHCALANTINYGRRNRVWVDSGQVDWNGYPPEGEKDVIAETPNCAAAFVCAFDAQKLPEFVGEGWAA